jgi:hypothetical protein
VRRGLGFSGAGRDRRRRELPCGERREGLEKEDDVWGHAVRERDGGGQVPFRVLASWASGWIDGWAEWLPGGLLFFFCFLFSFLIF